MSKALALLAVPAVLGVAALAAWNLSLSSDLADLRAELATPRDPATREAPKSGGTSAQEPKRAESGRATPQVTDLLERVATLERSLVTVKGAAPTSAEPAAATDEVELPIAYRSDEFKAAVGQVLDEREEAKRRERVERQADTMTKIWLRETDVTETQTKDVARVVLDSLVAQQAVRDNESLTDDQRKAELTTIDERRHDQISSILSAQQMEIVSARLSMRRQNGVQPPAPPGSLDRIKKINKGKRQGDGE